MGRELPVLGPEARRAGTTPPASPSIAMAGALDEAAIAAAGAVAPGATPTG